MQREVEIQLNILKKDTSNITSKTNSNHARVFQDNNSPGVKNPLYLDRSKTGSVDYTQE